MILSESFTDLDLSLSASCFSGNVFVDVVLSCSLVEEGAGMGGMRGGSYFTHTPSTLVFKDVEVPPDESLENFTPFVPPSVPDPDAILIEAKGLPCLFQI